MKTYRNLYPQLCSYENLELAFSKARKKKITKQYVIDFESNLEENLTELKHELETFTYAPSPLTTFTVRDPKTRRISASHFRDRIVHHALCNIIAPIFEKRFINDSFANQKGKGTHSAIRRFEKFMRKVSSNGTNCGMGGGNCVLGRNIQGYVLKADIKQYFDSINHEILLEIIRTKIIDPRIIWLIKQILSNYKTRIPAKGMPLGNLTSQFFANVYLNELDYFAKHTLKAKYYLRYVDDFVILHTDKAVLERWQHEIDTFLRNNLKVDLHPDKSRIVPLKNGITLLGFRIFHGYRLLKKSNARRIWKRLDKFKQKHKAGDLEKEKISQSLDGWLAYAGFANTYNLRMKVASAFAEAFNTSK